jgi:hypothetical protein
MPPADPICIRRALADADRPLRCDERLGLALQGPDDSRAKGFDRDVVTRAVM